MREERREKDRILSDPAAPAARYELNEDGFITIGDVSRLLNVRSDVRPITDRFDFDGGSEVKAQIHRLQETTVFDTF
ncbi:MAG: hypothetical protein J6Z80_03785 [Clostridia bacterium]|nr:hypothetical protein [Clostridia bacterium]